MNSIPMHTLYIDKPMRGHGLVQAIARVNRVWGDKPGGLVVDAWVLAPSYERRWRDIPSVTVTRYAPISMGCPSDAATAVKRRGVARRSRLAKLFRCVAVRPANGAEAVP